MVGAISATFHILRGLTIKIFATANYSPKAAGVYENTHTYLCPVCAPMVNLLSIGLRICTIGPISLTKMLR